METAQYHGKLHQRRALICRSKMNAKWADPIVVWIDDDGRCALFPMSHKDKAGRPLNPLWHAYQLERGFAAVRCPRSVTEDEKWRIIIDIPEGSAIFKFRAFLAENGKHSAVAGGGKSVDTETSWSQLAVAAMALFFI